MCEPHGSVGATPNCPFLGSPTRIKYYVKCPKLGKTLRHMSIIIGFPVEEGHIFSGRVLKDIKVLQNIHFCFTKF